ncbi:MULTISPECIES: polysaccharide pyruvyl transferase family protein [Kosmotoga]|uniref:Uncharacterized conserved protein n=1 Tax=Kosmotoga olearia (strain ATCC BAA-1733 / DSM 21960 / TBF 19.5.1) TaxID=521045 RepID=B5M6M4_KOSOT|nr:MULTISPECIES: polysaccharide pyruvyl transferase family protein [Kosmotoga]ACH68628.1 uncharacterized conserved protein [Kosmotoga olearia TBF 19.5.1]ACR80324.1 conserved hypothetical protein [Kosmotoga olearia TBF 19.5.1]OAA20255.1 hypothetical protein DU53_08970 [Kosmotoga sp. DU53]
MKKNKPVILLEGKYGPGNLGDDILMIVSSKVLLECCRDCEIVIELSKPEIVKNWLSGVTLLNHFELKKAPVLKVLGGGGQFYSFPLSWNIEKTKKGLGVRKLVHGRKVLSALKNRLGKIRKHWLTKSVDTAIFCVGVGPFVENSPQQEEARNMLMKSSYVSVRDSNSFAICKAWGIRNVKQFTDPAFLYEFWRDANIPANEIKFSNIERSIAFIPRYWPHDEIGQSYLKPMLKVAKKLNTQNIKSIFYFFSKYYDREIIEFVDNQGFNVKVWDPETNQKPARFVEQIAEQNMLVVSARAHGVILPAIFGIPGIAVEIEPKLVNVHRMLPRGTKLWQKPFNPDSLLKMIQEMLENNDEFRRLVNEDVSYNHNIALEAKADIQRFIRDYLKKQHHV